VWGGKVTSRGKTEGQLVSYYQFWGWLQDGVGKIGVQHNENECERKKGGDDGDAIEFLTR